MDKIETLAKQYLDTLGFGEAVYEPDGNVPPDFVLDSRIAVEVTRLNQNFESAEAFIGLENDQAALIRLFEKLLPKYGGARDGKGWWVFYSFRRPLNGPMLKVVIPKVLDALTAFPIQGEISRKISPTFELELTAATIHQDSLYSLGGYSDFDSGGGSSVS
ncbi:MAG: hypothetical protein WDN06_05090 [Asticcacaulis sp.]